LVKIGGLVEQSNLTMYRITSIKDEPGSAGEILKLFAEKNVSLKYITESSIPSDTAVMTLCVDDEQGGIIDHILSMNEHITRQIKISKIENVSLLGIYGPHFREKPFLAAQFCKILGRAGVNILGLSSSISSISSIIASTDHRKGKTALLAFFELP